MSYDERFEHAATPLVLLLPGIVLYARVTILVVYLSVRRGRPQLSIVVSLAGGAVTLLLALVLIPALGTPGAAVASTAGYAVGGLLAWAFFRRLSRQPESELS